MNHLSYETYKKLVPEIEFLMKLIPDLKFHHELEDFSKIDEDGCLILRCYMCNKVRSYCHEDDISMLLNYFDIDLKRKNDLWRIFENKTRAFMYVCKPCIDKFCVGYNKESGNEL